MIETVVPLRDYILVEKKRQADGAIVIPDALKAPERVATVVAVGPGAVEYGVLIKPVVEVGDEVLLIHETVGIPVPGYSDLVLVQEKQIIAVTARKDKVQ